MSITNQKIFEHLNRKVFDHRNKTDYLKNTTKGLSKTLIKKISRDKDEPKWMLDLRLQALEIFLKKPMPTFGPDISNLNFNEITYYVRPGTEQKNKWEDVPEDIKKTFDRLGIPEAEKKMLAGAGAQYESEMVYHSLKEKWSKLGVIFEDMNKAVKKYPELVKKYFAKCVPITDHKFAALHFAVFSGGTFLYVPKGVKLNQPVQAYFRMNAPSVGQFEHTLIIAEEDSIVHYIEGCSAPKYGKRSIHAGCVEIFVNKNAKMRYSSVENWSKDTYNLNTKRAIIEDGGHMQWVGGNMGSAITMLYPCSILKGDYSSSDHLGIAFANKGQEQDTGSKVIHLGKHTKSKVVMKSLSKGGGKSIYRGLINITKNAKDAVSSVKCDALILDEKSISDTIPDIIVKNNDVSIVHEACAGKVNEEDLFYLKSRGLQEDEAMGILVNGFLSEIVKELPLEYAVEMNK